MCEPKYRPFKVWDKERIVTNGFTVSSFQELKNKGCEKLQIDPPVRVVLAEDGTEIDEEYFSFLPDNTVFMLLPGRSEWMPPHSSITSYDHPDGAVLECGRKDCDLSSVIEKIKVDLACVVLLNEDEMHFDGQDKYVGRKRNKYFLYEIVSNKRNGIDVDKWDYLARDCHHLGIKNNFEHTRFMNFARVIEAKGPDDDKKVLQICIRDKEIGNLYNMFYARFTIHKIACQHRVTKTIENMVATALVKANAELKFKGTDGEEFTMLECIHDMKAFSKLTDNVILEIRDHESDSKNMKEAKDILKRIMLRKLDTLVCESGSLERIADINDEREKIKDEILHQYQQTSGQYNLPVEKDDVHIQFQNFDFGMEKRNPLKKLLVYSKGDDQKAFPLPEDMVSRILGPIVYAETFIRVTSRKRPNNFFKKAAESVLEKRKRHN